MIRVLIVILVALSCLGCQRTVYTNLQGVQKTATKVVDALPSDDEADDGTWQHFFVYGWVPGVKVIDASEECGGAANIKTISTKRSFGEGAVAMFASAYINIYSPYDGHVTCFSKRPPERVETKAE